MRQLLEAGAHFGHQTHRWNPKMERYIFGSRANIHIIDLSQTIPLLHQALLKVREVAAAGGRVLFVGTKRQASDPVAGAAKRCAQYYVNHRWLGGTLTNWRTISGSITRLREQEAVLDGDPGGRRHFAHLQQRLVQQRNGLGKVDDVDVGARAEDEALHLRVPAVGLVAEVGAALEQLTHRKIGKRHGRCLVLLPVEPPQATPPLGRTGTEGAGCLPAPAERLRV